MSTCIMIQIVDYYNKNQLKSSTISLLRFAEMFHLDIRKKIDPFEDSFLVVLPDDDMKKSCLVLNAIHSYSFFQNIVFRLEYNYSEEDLTRFPKIDL